MSSPVGLLFIAASERGLRHLEFMDRRSLKRTIAGHPDDADATWEPSLLDLKPVVDQLESYFNGGLFEFRVPLDPRGTEFQIAVWHALLKIPYGETRSYGDIAKAVGQPRSARAVGLANNQNPLAIIVPCHRVIGADGSLTGYGGGVQRKKWLLAHEARFSAPAGKTGDLFAETGRSTPKARSTR
jgi:methylated-DNA-[protein]-cysteine S-methyltransferase